MILEGEGQNNTELVSNATTGDAITVDSGKVVIQNLTLTSDGTSRSANAGSGNGLVFDPSQGVAPSGVYANVIARIRVENVHIDSQP